METTKETQNTAYETGWMDFWGGQDYTNDNPYMDQELRDAWSRGWADAEEDALREAARYDAQNEAYNGD